MIVFWGNVKDSICNPVGQNLKNHRKVEITHSRQSKYELMNLKKFDESLVRLGLKHLIEYTFIINS